MFDFLDIMDNYEDRKVARFDGKNDLMVDTAMITDAREPYETAVVHSKYNNGKMIIVEMYNSKSEAKKGHSKWVKLMTAKKLPDKLIDVCTASIAELLDTMSNDKWRQFNKK